MIADDSVNMVGIATHLPMLAHDPTRLATATSTSSHALVPPKKMMVSRADKV